MQILITNDDGIDSPGIWALAQAFSRDHQVTVVAPHTNRSGVAHSITTIGAVTIERRDRDGVVGFACSGTPADCVVLGVGELVSPQPDLVLSGINHGPNLADDVNYSGTVAGAIEATLLGIPAIAISLGVDFDDATTPAYWQTAADAARRIAALAPAELRGRSAYWNLNAPNIPGDRLAGIAVTRLGKKRVCDRVLGEEDDGARRYFRVWESPFVTTAEDADTDIAAVNAGYASLTPLLLDRTAFTLRESLTLALQRTF